MRILYMVGRELQYPRNEVMLRAFKRLGDVKVIASRNSSSILRNSLRAILKAIPNLFTTHYDVVFTGFYGHLITIFIGTITNKPILFDAFLSTYDTLCFEREKFSPGSLWGKLTFWIDKTSCYLAQHVLVDTDEHAEFFAQIFNLNRNKISSIPVGCNEDIFFPRRYLARNTDNNTRVLFYSTYLPQHGLNTIICAASALRSHPIQFRLLGSGPQYQWVKREVDRLELGNVTLLPALYSKKLADEIALADICLGGHFGIGGKSTRVIPGKIFQMLAMAKPVIVSDTKSVRNFLEHRRSAIICPAADCDALASAILELHSDPGLRQKVSKHGYSSFAENFSETVITDRLRDIVSLLMI